MSAFDAEYEPSAWEPIAQEVERYERTDGAEPSVLVGEAWIVLWTIGAKSGKVRKTPLVRVAERREGDLVGAGHGGVARGRRLPGEEPSGRSRSSCSSRPSSAGSGAQLPKSSRQTASAWASITSSAVGSSELRRRHSGASTNIVGPAPVRM